MLEVYSSIIDWSLDFGSVVTDDDFKGLVHSFTKMCDVTLCDIERFSKEYDLQKNLNDKWIKYFFDKKKQKHAGGFVEFHTYVKLSYKNVLDVEFRQELKMSIGMELGKHTISLIINEASPQEVLL